MLCFSLTVLVIDFCFISAFYSIFNEESPNMQKSQNSLHEPVKWLVGDFGR
jgi:hypothetical protein